MDESKPIKINNVFWTLQGEGAHAGRRALFVRMPHCDLKCPWCDTEFNTSTDWSEYAFKAFALNESARFAVITGGEPMMNKNTPRIVSMLKELGFEIACESNGNWPIVDGIDFVTVSPKRFQKNPYNIHPDALPKVSEFKYVVDDEFDFSILDRHDVSDGRRYSLSPEFNNLKASCEKIIEYIKEHPRWRLSLQTHKFLNIP